MTNTGLELHPTRRPALTYLRFPIFICALVSMTSFLRADESRIVAIGGPVTEIVYALGADKDLVGTDTSSIYPGAATRLPQVGYQRMLSAEGVLALHPTLIIASAE